MPEVELVAEVAEDPDLLAHGRARVGTAHRPGIEPRAVQEQVLDELQVRVEGQHLAVDGAGLRPRADEDPRHPDPVAVLVDARRRDVVVEAAPVVPGEEDGRRCPHHRAVGLH